ncbi:Hcp family type VI secretion system effector [Paenibacillus alginolyticus]|uniref:Type VI secretion system tube protein Hcp n=1 Tax=Paenibacillus alginolyticus TaxID=59839 RepID=A0ABT4GA36_9BACL|nr:type VI secretion system tube protein Hcp [Paenibacillus alginolyticus]MCY9693041.1 type VI secretion system tube protein Hcp [Paenibacillus alginolyticus]MEC0146165.1 hypothetical protein [Paenibacillus alginolyticus]
MRKYVLYVALAWVIGWMGMVTPSTASAVGTPNKGEQIITIYLKYPGVTGPDVNPTKTGIAANGWIVVDSAELQLATQVNKPASGGYTVGKPEWSPMTIKKEKTNHYLLPMLRQNLTGDLSVTGPAEISFVDQNNQEVMLYSLYNPFPSSYSMKATSQFKTEEIIELVYKKITMTTSTSGAPQSLSYDLSLNIVN